MPKTKTSRPGLYNTRAPEAGNLMATRANAVIQAWAKRRREHDYWADRIKRRKADELEYRQERMKRQERLRKERAEAHKKAAALRAVRQWRAKKEREGTWKPVSHRKMAT